MEIVLEAGHTHFYPGHVGSVEGGILPAADGLGVPCRIVFSDGAVAFVALQIQADGSAVLAVDPYRTVAGTGIAAKTWLVDFHRDPGGTVRFRIRRRAPD